MRAAGSAKGGLGRFELKVARGEREGEGGREGGGAGKKAAG